MDKKDRLSQLKGFYEEGKPLTDLNDNAVNDNYWVKAAKQENIKHLKFTNETLPEIYFDPPYIVAPNKVFNFFIGLSIREYKGDGHIQLNPTGVSFYSSYKTSQRKDFEFGYPIIVSEGVMDSEAISPIYPYSFACLGTLPSFATLKLINCLTNKFIFVPDADKNIDKLQWKLDNKICNKQLNYDIITLPKGIEDPGTFFKIQVGHSYKLLRTKLLNGVKKFGGEK